MEQPLQITNKLEERISDVFAVFDHHGDKTIDVHDVGNVLRFLGCAPTEKELNEIILATQEDDASGDVFLVKFMPHVAQLLMDRKMMPAEPEKLLAAFEVLDPEQRGYLKKDYFVKLMTEKGEPLNKKEIDKMLRIAVDPISGYIPYEFYLNKLKYKPKISIYEIAEEVAVVKRKEKEKEKRRY